MNGALTEVVEQRLQHCEEKGLSGLMFFEGWWLPPRIDSDRVESWRMADLKSWGLNNCNGYDQPTRKSAKT